MNRTGAQWQSVSRSGRDYSNAGNLSANTSTPVAAEAFGKTDTSCWLCLYPTCQTIFYTGNEQSVEGLVWQGWHQCVLWNAIYTKPSSIISWDLRVKVGLCSIFIDLPGYVHTTCQLCIQPLLGYAIIKQETWPHQLTCQDMITPVEMTASKIDGGQRSEGQVTIKNKL